ncbi:hypothetical protein [Micromonospora sp. CA-111912]|uniref:hypothetical protein n=1 Tax=Micromonospora sp. CA-111912 TaxID=3239955 RepID=UPI003D8A2C17
MLTKLDLRDDGQLAVVLALLLLRHRRVADRPAAGPQEPLRRPVGRVPSGAQPRVR